MYFLPHLLRQTKQKIENFIGGFLRTRSVKTPFFGFEQKILFLHFLKISKFDFLCFEGFHSQELRIDTQKPLFGCQAFKSPLRNNILYIQPWLIVFKKLSKGKSSIFDKCSILL
jgi:hypothetical protein